MVDENREVIAFVKIAKLYMQFLTFREDEKSATTTKKVSQHITQLAVPYTILRKEDKMI